MSATTHGGDVVMRPVARKGCTSEESGARCPCPQFVMGGKEIRFVCVNCGHPEAEHAPCSRKQYQFSRDQVDGSSRCLSCGLDVVAHVVAEDAPCSLTPEYFQAYQGRDPILVNGRCSGCGLVVGAHLSHGSAGGDSVFIVRASIPRALETYGWRSKLYFFASELGGTSLGDPALMCTYPGVELRATARPQGPMPPLECAVYFGSEDSARRFASQVRNMTVTAVINVERTARPVEPLQTVAWADYQADLYPSPPVSHSYHTDAEVRESAPVLQPRISGFDTETIHVLPRKDFPKYVNCVVRGNHLLNQMLDGHNADGIPRCYLWLDDAGTNITVVFYDEECRASLQFLTGSTLSTLDGRPSVVIPVTFSSTVVGVQQFGRACRLRRDMLLPLWQAKSRNPQLAIKRNCWASSSAVLADWDFASKAAFEWLRIGDRVRVEWAAAHGRSPPQTWNGTVRDAVRGEDDRLVIAFVEYDEGDPDVLYPLPNTRIYVHCVQNLGRAAYDSPMT